MGLKKLTTLALYTTLSLIIFAVESAIPPLVPIPGIKPGLANIITLILLRNASPKDTGLVLCARLLLSTILFGQAMSFLYSLAGASLSLAAMILVNRLLQNRYLFLTSMTGGVTHNLGQLLVAFLITKVSGVLLYLPFLVLAGMITGLFTGLCAHFAQKYLLPLIRRL